MAKVKEENQRSGWRRGVRRGRVGVDGTRGTGCQNSLGHRGPPGPLPDEDVLLR